MSVAIAGDLNIASDIARVGDRKQMLAAVLDPFHRSVELPGRERNQEILRKELPANAETSAGVSFDHLDLFFGQIKHAGQNLAIRERHLDRAPRLQTAFG